jgi:hypothetical protein
VGLLAGLFVYFIYAIAADASRRRDYLSYCLAIVLALSSLAYGSYIVPYDFIFILLFGALNFARLQTGRRPRKVLAPEPASEHPPQLAGGAVPEPSPAPN